MGARRRATLADVAARAGVSVTTASYVLNGRGDTMRISTDASTRVSRAALELAYRPNRSARNLRTSSTATIGVISHLVASGQYASRGWGGVAAGARANQHLLVIAETEDDPELEAQLVEELLDRQVDGVLYATLTAKRVTVPVALRKVPVVLLNCIDDAGDLPSVLPDEHAGGRLAVRTILVGSDPDPGAGGVHVVGEDPTPDAIAGPLRLEGISAELADRGAALGSVIPCEWDVRPAYDAVEAWLRTGQRPSGLICLNDRVAMGTYQALEVHGLRVPQDVSVVSFDGSSLASWLRPQLCSIALPFAELGARAAHLLLDPGRAAAGEVRLPMHLARGSSIRARPEPLG